MSEFMWRGRKSETYQDLFSSAAEVLLVLFPAVALAVEAELVAVAVPVLVVVVPVELPVSVPPELQ